MNISDIPSDVLPIQYLTCEKLQEYLAQDRLLLPAIMLDECRKLGGLFFIERPEFPIPYDMQRRFTFFASYGEAEHCRYLLLKSAQENGLMDVLLSLRRQSHNSHITVTQESHETHQGQN